MAIITEMLGEKVISGFKGTLDFYYHDGIACVRKWPRSPGHRRAPAVTAGWAPFTSAVHLWNVLPLKVRDPFKSMAGGTALSGRDMFMRAYMTGIPTLYDLPHSPLPAPPSSYWAILDWEKILLDDGFGIITTTAVPCHLWLCWTTIPPVRHIDPVLRRGLFMHGNPRYCFVAYNCIEQEDPGDTLIHTWNLHNWPECERRWFTFHGEIGGVASPSTFALDSLHFGHLAYQCDGPELAHYPISAHFTQYAVFKVNTAHIPNDIRVTMGRNGEPGEVKIDLVRLKSDGWPDTEVLDSDTKVITGIPEIPYFGHFTYQFPKAHLGKEGWYCLKATCEAVPPVEARWKGWPINICPDSYVITHRLYDDRWFTYPEMQLYFLSRGILL